MSIKFREIKNKEESTVNKGTTYKYSSTDNVTREDKKKLERPNFNYTPKNEMRTMASSNEGKRKLR